ncbi:hypothetical protein GBAR_LOCUS30758 [Geodia barretti]|uniref:Uncharacterized protein n=1 Tax=Geodia barretti TaxID=519541 RepID=A0AA35U0M4_GEOBA|nr:hypothetical protein GBAR_LOCUS30758 [Geodia barretti]
MAVDEYNRKLEIRRQKYAFGKDLLEVIAQDSTPKELQGVCTAAAKMGRKIGKIEDATQELKQEVLQRRRDMEEEMRSEFVEATGQDRDPDTTVVQEEIERVSQQVKEKEKNCSKLIKEKKMLDYDRLQRKVFKGIAPIHFDKTSSDSHVKGCILSC